MQYKCDKCLDTGSIKGELYLDCTSCDVAKERADLHAYMAKNQFMHPYELAWLVHQRALAMAPKQEAPQVDGWIATIANGADKPVFTRSRFMTQKRDAEVCAEQWRKQWPHWHIAVVGYSAAPAAANGAIDHDAEMSKIKDDVDGLMGYGFMVDGRRVGMDRIVWFNRPPEERLHERAISNDEETILADFSKWIGPRQSYQTAQEIAIVYWAQEAYRAGRLAAAGPDAALMKALEGAMAVIDDYLAYTHDGDPWKEDARAMGEMDINDADNDGRIESWRAALSGAKGN